MCQQWWHTAWWRASKHGNSSIWQHKHCCFIVITCPPASKLVHCIHCCEIFYHLHKSKCTYASGNDKRSYKNSVRPGLPSREVCQILHHYAEVTLRGITLGVLALFHFLKKFVFSWRLISYTCFRKMIDLCVCVCLGSVPGGSCYYPISIATSSPRESPPYVLPSSTSPPVSLGSFQKGVPTGST